MVNVQSKIAVTHEQVTNSTKVWSSRRHWGRHMYRCWNICLYY